MALDLNALDPQIAWRSYEPNAAAPWTRARAAHLFRRAGFGASPAELDAAVRETPESVIERLFAPGARVASFAASADQLATTAATGGGSKQLAAAWVYRLLGTPDPLREKLTLFWHGHFTSSADKVTDARLMLAQNNLLREHALGDFASLVQQISCDPAMLIYLDSATNRKAHPNENYARELMELFCLGEGNYTEHDVTEVARCFTGWEVRRDRYRFNKYEHDSGNKSFLGATGDFDGADAVRIVLQQPAAPRFIARKLFQFFICDEPSPPEALIEPLAVAFRESDLNVGTLVRKIVGSELFFSDAVIGRKIRSPADVAIGLLRAFDGSADANMLATGMAEIGQSLLYPPNVKGWPGGRNWIDSSTLLGRANLVRRLLDDGKTRFGGGSLTDYAKRSGVSESPEAQVEWIANLLLAIPMSSEVQTRIVALAGDERDDEKRLRNIVYIVCSLPEFQLA
jgi:uncharacterized protein (DUF1800 family)